MRRTRLFSIPGNASLFERRGDPWGDPAPRPAAAPVKMSPTDEKIEAYRRKRGLHSKFFPKERTAMLNQTGDPGMDQYTLAKRVEAKPEFNMKRPDVPPEDVLVAVRRRLAQARLKSNNRRQGRQTVVVEKTHEPSQLEMNTDPYRRGRER